MEARSGRESETIMSMVMGPSDANSAGNVHGGVIMRAVDNAAGVVAMRHSRRTVVTVAIDRIEFHRPCFAGEVLTCRASLNHVGTTSMDIGVRVEAENPLTGELRHIASAYLTFVALGTDRKPTPVPPLLLETDEDRRRSDQARSRRESVQRLRT